jgi:HEAT repeat protein
MRGALLLLLLALPASAGAGSKTAPVPRDTVEPKLVRYHPDPAQWRALGPGTDQTLIEIAGDPKAELLVRSRAVSTLGYFATAASRRFLETTIESKGTSADAGDRLLVRRAAVALGWLGGMEVPGRLAPLLSSDDADVRLDTAVGLGLTRLPAAAAALRKRLDIEPADKVRAQISRQIQAIEAALAPKPEAKK